MNPELIIAYDKLVPVDQAVVDIIILTLTKKDAQIGELVDALVESPKGE